MSELSDLAKKKLEQMNKSPKGEKGPGTGTGHRMIKPSNTVTTIASKGTYDGIRTGKTKKRKN